MEHHLRKQKYGVLTSESPKHYAEKRAYLGPIFDCLWHRNKVVNFYRHCGKKLLQEFQVPHPKEKVQRVVLFTVSSLFSQYFCSETKLPVKEFLPGVFPPVKLQTKTVTFFVCSILAKSS